MNLRATTVLLVSGISFVLLVPSLFIPWQTGSFFGADVEPGLWTVRTSSAFGDDATPYSEYEDMDAGSKALVRIAAIATIGATLAALSTLVAQRTGRGDRRLPGILAATAGALALVAVITFQAAVTQAFDNADEFFSWSHGINLALAAGILSIVAALAHFVIPARLRLSVSS